MKNRVNVCRLLLSAALLFVGTNGVSSAQWMNIGPGGGSDLQSIAVHPTNSDIAYVGGDIEGIFKTTDGGQTWSSVNNNLATGPWTPDVYWTNQIVFDQSDASYNTLFYCTAVGMFRTTDGGASWTNIFPGTVATSDDLTSTYSVGQNPSNMSELYVGTEGKGVFKSTDSGATWSKLTTPVPDAATVYGTQVATNGMVFIGSTEGVYSSSDGGSSWTSGNSGLPHTTVWNLKLVESSGQRTLFATLPTQGTEGQLSSFRGGIFRSTDDGANWTDISSDLPRMQSDGLFYYFWKFTVDKSNPNSMFIGTSVSFPEEGAGAWEDWGVYHTTDGGAHWNRSDTSVNLAWMDDAFLPERHALVLAMAPSDSNVIYWGRDWMNRTTDGGQNWTQIYSEHMGNAWKGTGFELMMVEGVTFDPTNSSTVYVGYDDMGPFRSDDHATSFVRMDAKMDPYDGDDAGKDIEVDPSNGDVYMSRYDGIGSAAQSNYSLGSVWHSTNRGMMWTRRSTGLPAGRPDLVLDPVAGSPGNRTLYCASYGNTIYKTTDSGNSWTASGSGLGSDADKVWEVQLNPNNRNELYAGINAFGAGGGLYKSTDSGGSWTKLTSFPAFDVLTIDYDGATNTLYVGATDNFDFNSDGGLYRSSDGGLTWTKIFDHTRVSDVEIDPADSNTIYAASQPWYEVWLPGVSPGVYKTTDGGGSWSNITGNISHTFIDVLKINPDEPSQLFVGTGGGGLWVNSLATDVEERDTELPDRFDLEQNYPNPFNPTTTIRYQLSAPSRVTLKVFDLLGREVDILVNGIGGAGAHEVHYDASKLSSGVYFYQLTANPAIGSSSGGLVQTRKMVLMR